jgi:hypothetical protein
MNSRKMSLFLIILVLGMFLLAACSSTPTPKSGEVHGTLVTEDGQPLTDTFNVALCKVTTDLKNCSTDSDYETATVNGTFSFDFVPVGNYALYITYAGSEEGAFLQQSDGETLVIQLQANKEFDLGKIKFSPIQ